MYHIGQYVPGESIIHRLDPRVKIGSAVVLSILILKGGILTEGIASAFLLALVPCSRLAPHHMRNALRPVMFFFVLLFFLHLFFTDGTPIPPFPPWHVTVTYEGLHRGAMITWQFMLLILSASILTMTTTPTELVSGIERLLRPLKILGVPSHDVAIMISIALRFVPTFLEEIDRIKEAQMARGANFKTGPLARRAKATLSLLMPLVLCSLRRADELATAMEARGYRRGPRTYMKELSMTRADYVAVLVIILLSGLHFL
ncbi:MAG: energy-coupling factor transporter transmembrane component T [Pseudomonadota bacterium]